MRIQLEAPAKLTLSLRVTGIRADGYHLISAEMVSLDIYDSLSVDPNGNEFLVVADGHTAEGSENDLVQRALRAVDRQASVLLTKRIPAGAGLGGGSSDAAAILRWANQRDPQVAAAIGADVAFCVSGGRAQVGGIGELLQPLQHIDRVFTLYTPPMHCSTPVVYQAWDNLGGPRGENGNDLEPAALSAYPGLAEYRDRFALATGEQPRLAGSGSTWFVEGAFKGEGHVIAHTVRPH
ncbi:MAG: 4-(cytidine 5'-diphospho)-2-C-methyl-D-erythritol kinase [Microthrixaceae bacterium]